MAEVSDAELLIRFRGGDDAALEALFVRELESCAVGALSCCAAGYTVK